MMTINEADAASVVLRFATGDTEQSAERIRDAVTTLAKRAGDVLQARIHIDPHDLDAAIARTRGQQQ